MKVKELLAALEGVDPEAEVILQRDAEGNGYSPLSAVDDQAVYVAETTWSGDVYSLGWSADDAGVDDDAWVKISSQPRCVVLAPVN